MAATPKAPSKVVSVTYIHQANETAQLTGQASTARPASIRVPPASTSKQGVAQKPVATNRWPQLLATAPIARPVSLWATYYYVHQATEIAGGQPILDMNGKALTRISRKDWCYGSLQGTVQVVNSHGVPVTYNYVGRGSREQVDCSAYFSSLSGSTLSGVNSTRFEAVAAPYGLGTGGYNLVPYRTIAVDPNRIPIGSVIYIPAARGTKIILPSGQQVVHDGYFFAADVGGAIRGNHIDIFIGVAERNPFPFVTSSAGGTFEAYIINNAEIAQTLSALHRSR